MNKLRALHLDLIVVDVFPLNKCLVLLPHILNIPFIYHAGCPEPSWKFRIPSLASVIPIIKPFGKPKSEVMTFLERTQNFLFQAVLHVWFFPGTTDYELIKKYRQSDDITEYDQIALQAEMFFFNRDHLLEYSRWFLPNAVALGGLTARDAKTLPDDWLKFANSATDGFILVSFGSVVDSFPEHVIRKMTDAFLMVKYHVIWRISKHIPNLPQRIRVLSNKTYISKISKNILACRLSFIFLIVKSAHKSFFRQTVGFLRMISLAIPTSEDVSHMGGTMDNTKPCTRAFHLLQCLCLEIRQVVAHNLSLVNSISILLDIH